MQILDPEKSKVNTTKRTQTPPSDGTHVQIVFNLLIYLDHP